MAAGELHPAGDLLAEAAREMPAHHRGHRPPKRAVGDLLLGVRVLGVEALRIADGKLQPVALCDCDQFVGFEQLERDRFSRKTCLPARRQSRAIGNGSSPAWSKCRPR
jgi:hypothetical protein